MNGVDQGENLKRNPEGISIFEGNLKESERMRI